MTTSTVYQVLRSGYEIVVRGGFKRRFKQQIAVGSYCWTLQLGISAATLCRDLYWCLCVFLNNKSIAAYQLFLYALFGSVLMLLAILLIFFEAGTTDLETIIYNRYVIVLCVSGINSSKGRWHA